MAIAFTGSLARYYAGATATPTAAAVAKLRVGVEAWCHDLRASVADKVRDELHWDEGAATTSVHDLGDSGFLALRLLAFLADRSDLEWPDTVPPLLEVLPEWRADAEAKFQKSRYGHLLACHAWLPGDFPVTLRVPMPDGEAAEVGSVQVLADQLKWLNQRTFQAEAGEVAEWANLPAPAAGEFVAAARRGFAGLSAAVAAARSWRLPLVVRLP